MAAAYHFFKDKLTKSNDLNDDPIDPTKVLITLEQCLQIVMINLGDDDDPYLIFESLNFKGEPLTQADLVRNYLLMRFRHSISAGREQERVYSKYWIPLESMLKSNLTEFLRHYIMKDGYDMKQGGIYAATRAKLKGMELTEEVEAEVHTTLVSTFGNLTLTSYNSELSNLPFLEKKVKLENTHIELNRWILQQNSWGVPEIEERAKSLLDIANKIWLAPLDMISD